MLGVFMYVRNICTTMAMNTETSWIPSQWNRCWSILYANLLQWLDVGITLGNDTPTLLSNPTSRGTFFEPQGLCIEVQVLSMRKTNHLKWCWCDNIVLPNIVGLDARKYTLPSFRWSSSSPVPILNWCERKPVVKDSVVGLSHRGYHAPPFQENQLVRHHPNVHSISLTFWLPILLKANSSPHILPFPFASVA